MDYYEQSTPSSACVPRTTPPSLAPRCSGWSSPPHPSFESQQAARSYRYTSYPCPVPQTGPLSLCNVPNTWLWSCCPVNLVCLPMFANGNIPAADHHLSRVTRGRSCDIFILPFRKMLVLSI